MKLEKNMYVRTKVGEIHKCLLIYIDDNNQTLNRFMNEWGNMIMFDEIKGEPSHNIIDLIEVGDYVNGEKVVAIHEHYVCDEIDLGKALETACNYTATLNEDIKSIVTKEQFEQMQYKVGEQIEVMGLSSFKSFA